jgi:Rod binding domain-containing protein
MDDLQVIGSMNNLDVQRDGKAWKAAQEMESNFIAEMLKQAGLGKARERFGGGIGEEQFASFLTQEYAKATVSRGGIGLAEHIYNSITSQGNE